MDKNEYRLIPTHLEYIEFTSREEFHKFRHMPLITKGDIKKVNWASLIKKLQEG